MLLEYLFVVQDLTLLSLFQHNLVEGGDHGAFSLILLNLRKVVRRLVHTLLLLGLSHIHSSGLGRVRLSNLDSHVLGQNVRLAMGRRLLSLAMLVS